jgi:hypothetical protein
MLLFEGKLINVESDIMANKLQAMCSARTKTKTASNQSTWVFWLCRCNPSEQRATNQPESFGSLDATRVTKQLLLS